MKIMNNIKKVWRNAANATRIRAGMSVRKMLENINLLILMFSAVVVALAAAYIKFERLDLAAACGAILCCVAWLCGLRKAIAESQEARKKYLTETWRRFKTFCRGLGNTILVLTLLAVSAAVTLSTLAVLVKLGRVSSELLDILPALRGLADKIIVHLNDGLIWLSSFIR